MKENNHLFWYTLGIALSVSSLVSLVTGNESLAMSMTFVVGVLFSLIGLYIKFKHSTHKSFLYRLSPLFMDVGANSLVAGIFLEASVYKILFILIGVLLIEVFLLICMEEHLR